MFPKKKKKQKNPRQVSNDQRRENKLQAVGLLHVISFPQIGDVTTIWYEGGTGATGLLSQNTQCCTDNRQRSKWNEKN